VPWSAARTKSTYSCLAQAGPASRGGPDMATPTNRPSRSATDARFSR